MKTHCKLGFFSMCMMGGMLASLTTLEASRAQADQPRVPKLTALKPKPGYVIGRCVNMAGRPLANVAIFIKGVTLQGGQRTETFAKTKADGSYSMRVPAGMYSVYADHKVDAYDQTYKFRLEALDGDSDTQDSTEGVVEDFVWKIKGLRPDSKAKATSEREWNYSYYGARVYPDTRRSLGKYTNIEDATSLSQTYPKDSQLEITLKPEGTLIDGSKGTTITERLRLGDDGQWTFGIRNIPVGIYTATVKVITPDQQTVNVRCKVDEEGKNIDEVPWAGSARLVFPASYNEYGQTAKLYLARP